MNRIERAADAARLAHRLRQGVREDPLPWGQVPGEHERWLNEVRCDGGCGRAFEHLKTDCQGLEDAA